MELAVQRGLLIGAWYLIQRERGIVPSNIIEMLSDREGVIRHGVVTPHSVKTPHKQFLCSKVPKRKLYNWTEKYLVQTEMDLITNGLGIICIETRLRKIFFFDCVDRGSHVIEKCSLFIMEQAGWWQARCDSDYRGCIQQVQWWMDLVFMQSVTENKKIIFDTHQHSTMARCYLWEEVKWTYWV